jgi:hypothetical protein
LSEDYHQNDNKTPFSYANTPFDAKIIVAEDQLINLEVLRDYIEKMGFANSTEYCIDG